MTLLCETEGGGNRSPAPAARPLASGERSLGLLRPLWSWWWYGGGVEGERGTVMLLLLLPLLLLLLLLLPTTRRALKALCR